MDTLEIKTMHRLIRYSQSDDTDPAVVSLMVEETLNEMRRYLHEQRPKEVACQCLSTRNYIQRSQIHPDFLTPIKIGDVCYIDFGPAYRHEAGYQHFGLVMSVVQGKLFVLPMTSNQRNYDLAYDPKDNPKGKRHLMRFGQGYGLNKSSVLFLNDGKFISSSRVIEVKGNMPPHLKRFEEIRLRLSECLFQSDAIL